MSEMDVNVKGKKTKSKAKGPALRQEEPESPNKKQPSKVEGKRTKPGAYEKMLIKKMSKEQKEIAIKFMLDRNEARVRAHMEPAYSQSDIDLYK